MPPPEEPTRPLSPAVHEREIAAPAEDPYRTEILLDQLRSLRAALAIVGVIAVAALGVALYTVLTKEEESDTGAGASRQQVEELADRVDALESDVEDRATKDDVSQIADDVEALGKRVDRVAKQAGSSGTDSEARSSIDQVDENVRTLSQSVEDLDERVRELEEQPQQQQP